MTANWLYHHAVTAADGHPDELTELSRWVDRMNPRTLHHYVRAVQRSGIEADLIDQLVGADSATFGLRAEWLRRYGDTVDIAAIAGGEPARVAAAYLSWAGGRWSRVRSDLWCALIDTAAGTADGDQLAKITVTSTHPATVGTSTTGTQPGIAPDEILDHLARAWLRHLDAGPAPSWEPEPRLLAAFARTTSTEACWAVYDTYRGVTVRSDACWPDLDLTPAVEVGVAYLCDRGEAGAHLLEILFDLAPWVMCEHRETLAAALPGHPLCDPGDSVELLTACASARPPTPDTISKEWLVPDWVAATALRTLAANPAVSTDELHRFLDSDCDYLPTHSGAVIERLFIGGYLQRHHDTPEHAAALLELIGDIGLLDRIGGVAGDVPAVASAWVARSTTRNLTYQRLNALDTIGALDDATIGSLRARDVITSDHESLSSTASARIGTWVCRHLGIERFEVAGELSDDLTLGELAEICAAARPDATGPAHSAP